MDDPRYSRLDLVRGVAVLAALYLTAGLLWLLPSPGYTTTRLVLMAVVLAFGWLGAVGAVRDRPRVVAAGVAGLFLLGFWQAVLWVFVLPTAFALLVVAVALAAADRGGRGEPPGGAHAVEGE